jgi:hypothetical protein
VTRRPFQPETSTRPEPLCRRIVHFNVTEHPTAAWTAQQVVEAFLNADVVAYLSFAKTVAGRGRCLPSGRHEEKDSP